MPIRILKLEDECYDNLIMEKMENGVDITIYDGNLDGAKAVYCLSIEQVKEVLAWFTTVERMFKEGL